MKRILIPCAVLVSIVASALIVFYPYFSTIAEKDFPYDGSEPDLPPFVKTGVDKEKFMRRRDEAIALKRRIDKDKPLPDRKARQRAIAKMENQQKALRAMPESEEKESLMMPWTPIGPAPIPNGQVQGPVPTPVSGRVTSIAVHSTNPNIVYVGTAQGKLYRTTDGGTNWMPLMDNAMSLAIGAVAIAPSNPEIVYVGTGEANGSIDSFFGVGVYRITNASSASPTVSGPLNRNDRAPSPIDPVDVFTGRAISKIVINHVDPSNIWVATTSGLGGIGGSVPAGNLPFRGVYRSFNATSENPTFRQVGVYTTDGANFRADLDVNDIALDPLNVDLMVANVSTNGVVGGFYWSREHRASTINNITWTRTLQLNNNANARFAIHHTVANVPSTIYAATGNGGGRVLRSTDHNVFVQFGGFSWTSLVTNNFCGGQCFYDIALAVDPTNPNRVYLGGDPGMVFGISNNTVTGFTRSEAGVHVDTHAIAVAPSQPSTIYLGTDGGIYRSTNSGASWTSLNNTQFSATQF